MIDSNIFVEIKNFIIALFFLSLMKTYFNIFLESRSTRGIFQLIVYVVFLVWQLIIIRRDLFPVYLNVGTTILVTTLIATNVYKGAFWNKCIFAIAFDAIWMLTETLCGYILSNYFENYLELQQIGSSLSVLMLFAIVLALKKVFTPDEVRELPTNYSLILLLIPMGSIYIIYNLFMLSSKIPSKGSNTSSLTASVILLLINILIFSIYLKLADDLQLKRRNSAYEQQLELCERHQHETELSMMQIRDAKHNMRNQLVSILAYIEKGDCQKANAFINEVIDESGMNSGAIANTGNIVIDSLTNFWASQAEKAGIDFKLESHMPMYVPFKGADICLILGNALQNSVEAASDIGDDKYIHIAIKYDKDNLIISIKNSFNGYVKRSKDGKFKSTKEDAESHGLGLESIYRMAKKYQGTVLADVLEKEFCLRVLLYCPKEK